MYFSLEIPNTDLAKIRDPTEPVNVAIRLKCFIAAGYGFAFESMRILNEDTEENTQEHKKIQ
jgi:hypothetical protein